MKLTPIDLAAVGLWLMGQGQKPTREQGRAVGILLAETADRLQKGGWLAHEPVQEPILVAGYRKGEPDKKGRTTWTKVGSCLPNANPPAEAGTRGATPTRKP